MSLDKLDKINLVASDTSWVEGDAVRQLEQTAGLPGIERAVGLPDLHPGKGIPIGAAFLSRGLVYPHLVGNDIGCGMGLWKTDINVRKFKLDKVVKKLDGFEQPWDGDTETMLEKVGLPTDVGHALGTIGGGNHFAEFLKIEQVFDDVVLGETLPNENKIVLLVHSGSRGLGEAVLNRHIRKYKAKPLLSNTEDFAQYISDHNQAVTWARLNRQIIAKRFLDKLGAHGKCLLDIFHNTVTPYGEVGDDLWLHRKGAAPADKGMVIIPGSRGTLSYLVQPIEDAADIALASLAHGAGRKWKRSEAKGKLENRYRAADLTRTKLGGRVICEDKALIFEEAPEAYKNIETVISDMEQAGLIKTVASFRPLISYKTRRK